MSPIALELSALGIIDCNRLQLFHPRVRDREDISVWQDPITEVILLSSSEHIKIDYYKSKPERPEHAVLGQMITTPPLEDDIRRANEFGSLLRNKRWLDFGCGLGGVMDMMSGKTAYAVGLEPSKDRASIAAAKGHSIIGSLSEIPKASLEIISMFHVLEHLTSPAETLAQARERLKPGGTILIEVPHAKDALFTLYKSTAFKNFTFWSEHLVLHTRQSLELLLKHAGFTRIQVSGKQRYPLSNHLHWLALEEPGGHEAWGLLNSQELSSAYEASLSKIDRTDTLIATARVP